MRHTPHQSQRKDHAHDEFTPAGPDNLEFTSESPSSRTVECMARIAAVIAVLCLTASAAAIEPTSPRAPPPDLCGPSDRVVWLNTKSGVYYLKGDPSYGRSGGHFMCQAAADHEGDQAAVVGFDE